jgi:hypothetical protein
MIFMGIEKQTIFEKLGVEYEEQDGILYPKLDGIPTEKEQLSNIGKYGLLWVDYMKEIYPIRYHTLLRFGELQDKARMVNDLAYELLDDIESEWLSQHKPKKRDSFWEMYQLRMQARMIAEEMVMVDVVRVWH